MLFQAATLLILVSTALPALAKPTSCWVSGGVNLEPTKVSIPGMAGMDVCAKYRLKCSDIKASGLCTDAEVKAGGDKWVCKYPPLSRLFVFCLLVLNVLLPSPDIPLPQQSCDLYKQQATIYYDVTCCDTTDCNTPEGQKKAGTSGEFGNHFSFIGDTGAYHIDLGANTLAQSGGAVIAMAVAGVIAGL